MTTRLTHRLLSSLTIATGTALMLTSTAIPDSSPEWIRNSLSNAGSAILGVGIVEVMYKTTLQQELLEEISLEFQKKIDLPVDALYFRRKYVPHERDLKYPEFWNTVKKQIFIKAGSYKNVTKYNLIGLIKNALKDNQELEIYFLICDPKSESLNLWSQVSKTNTKTLQGSINEFVDQLDTIRQSGFKKRLHYCLFDAVPINNLWLVDPNESQAWARISPRIVENKPMSESIVLFFKKSQSEEYYEELHHSLVKMWNDASTRTVKLK